MVAHDLVSAIEAPLLLRGVLGLVRGQRVAARGKRRHRPVLKGGDAELVDRLAPRRGESAVRPPVEAPSEGEDGGLAGREEGVGGGGWGGGGGGEESDWSLLKATSITNHTHDAPGAWLTIELELSSSWLVPPPRRRSYSI